MHDVNPWNKRWSSSSFGNQGLFGIQIPYSVAAVVRAFLECTSPSSLPDLPYGFTAEASSEGPFQVLETPVRRQVKAKMSSMAGKGQLSQLKFLLPQVTC